LFDSSFVSIVGFMRVFQRFVTVLKKVVFALVGLLILVVAAVFLVTPLSVSSSPVFVIGSSNG
jgi:hypothetical protein